MPLIDVRCANGHESEVQRPLAMYPATPACPVCQAATEQYHPPPRARWTVDPVIVFRAPDGTFRFPGDAAGTQAGRYRDQGFEQIELRGHADVRRFEKQMNEREYARAQRRVEIAQHNREIRESRNRSELRHLMQSMTRFGRDVARAAMDRNNQKPGMRAHEPGFRVEAYSEYRSNREESRDSQGRRRRD